MVSEKETLLIKSEAIKECVNQLVKKIKAEKNFLEQELADERALGCFEDCGDFYREQVMKRKSRVGAMIEQKISLEKYSKKLRHMSEEIEETV